MKEREAILLNAINLIFGSLPKYVGYTPQDQLAPYYLDEDCENFTAVLRVQVDQKGNLASFYSIVGQDDFEGAYDIGDLVSNSDATVLVKSYSFEELCELNTKTIQKDFSNNIGKFKNYVFPDCFDDTKFDKRLIKSIDIIYSSIPHQIDRTEEGVFEIRREIGEEGYIENIELFLEVMIGGKDDFIVPVYYSEDDYYFYMFDGYWEHYKVTKKSVISSFSKSFGWIENFEFEGKLFNR